MGRRILITGVGSHMGTELARRLTGDPGVEYVAGLDTRPPRASIEDLDFIDADIRNPLIGKLIPAAKVDTVVHNQIVRQPGPGLSPQQMHDINVIGSLQLLAACEKADSVRAIVIRGSAGIYGSEPHAPQFFTEEMTRLYPLRTRFQRDVGEIENYFETFSRRHPRVTCTMLRYQPAIGPALDTQVVRYLSQAIVPTYLGFDPRLQFVHESDGLDALVAAAHNPVRGAVNVAAEGTIGLTRMLRLARKTTLPLAPQLFEPVVNAGRRAGMSTISPDFRRLLRYGRGVDTTRLRDELGAAPKYTTERAVRDWVATNSGRRLVPSIRAMVARP
ncbi:MAG: NAD-dependent epimerase/dehydratase family protein [Thermoleophilaceae bacterium]|nr:NAD-dependent epimerase/dehydratase family protein [Thermoleophilaceae bacterium]